LKIKPIVGSILFSKRENPSFIGNPME